MLFARDALLQEARSPLFPLESIVPVYQILLILWVIVFAFWLTGQFKEYNRRRGR